MQQQKHRSSPLAKASRMMILLLLFHPRSMILCLLCSFIPLASPLSFNFTNPIQTYKSGNCDRGLKTICLQNSSYVSDGVIELTRSSTFLVGRAYYSEPVILWDSTTGKVTDFTTHFTFIIVPQNINYGGDGFAFFLSTFPSTVPPHSTGGRLGLFSNETQTGHTVAVEFDNIQNEWDPSPDHVGIDIDSISSDTYLAIPGGIKNRTGDAMVSYNSTTRNLSVHLTFANASEIPYDLSHIVDLRDSLPEWVAIGFSAGSGQAFEAHRILSWNFTSNLEHTVSPAPSPTPVTSTTPLPTTGRPNRVWLVVIFVAGFSLLLVGVVWFVLWKKKKNSRGGDVEFTEVDDSIDDELEDGKGPRRYSYNDLAKATKHFPEEGKLGEGGFGAVYRGYLSDLSLDVAIKRISKESKQGKKEYISEVKIISRLRHRNLVQLIGWCHERGDLLLVYEFMSNGSLDTHLFNKERPLLPWPVRYKIALGLASSLLYLHEEWEQCVVHRDIKSSNIMLDASFNAKLGDFGLARLVNHGSGLQTTFLAGTMGYLAPECFMTGKGSKESDVYSFGIVALEIACGRRCIEADKGEGSVKLVEFVWDLYGKGMLVEAADERLDKVFDIQQMERLTVVGLWCAHPVADLRPSIWQAISVLNLEATVPNLPPKMPMYSLPSANGNGFSYTSSLSATNSSATTSSSGGIQHDGSRLI